MLYPIELWVLVVLVLRRRLRRSKSCSGDSGHLNEPVPLLLASFPLPRFRLTTRIPNPANCGMQPDCFPDSGKRRY
jgi:hypothetical protein